MKINLRYSNYHLKIIILHIGKNIKLVSHDLINDIPIGPCEKILQVIEQYKLHDDSILIIGGDNYINFDLNDFYKFHRSTSTSCNAIYKNEKMFDSSLFGMTRIDTDRNIIGFKEKPKEISRKKISNSFISTACYIMAKHDIEILRKYLKAKKPDVLGEFLDWLRKKSKVKGYKFTDVWYDIGTRSSMLLANSYVLDNYIHKKYPEIYIDQETYICPGNFINEKTILSNAVIDEKVYVGKNCEIKNSYINNSIIYDNCIVKNSKISNCIIGANSIIEAKIINYVFGPKSSVLEGEIL